MHEPAFSVTGRHREAGTRHRQARWAPGRHQAQLTLQLTIRHHAQLSTRHMTPGKVLAPGMAEYRATHMYVAEQAG